jgi:glutamine cyclotransferase
LILAFLLTMPWPSIIGQSSRPSGPRRSREYTFKVVNVFPHDPAAFTQGLVYHDGFLYEGTGLNGRSQLRKVRLETGEVVQHADLNREFFGEGIAIVGSKVFQLTWQSHVGFVYNLADFKLLRQFSYPGEGWGLTSNGNDIFMSDGSAQIRALNAATFKESTWPPNTAMSRPRDCCSIAEQTSTPGPRWTNREPGVRRRSSMP